MSKIKNYDKNIYKKKFGSYRKTVLVFLVSLVISLLTGFVLMRRGALDLPLFRVLSIIREELKFETRGYFPIYCELLFFLFLFAMGPTIYAPVASVFALLLYGVSHGAMAGRFNFSGAVISLFFSALSGYVLVIYSAFITLTAMKIYTLPSGENEIFEGSLFRATRFRGIFNFRYLATYTLFFILFSLCASAVALVKNYLTSLL